MTAPLPRERIEELAKTYDSLAHRYMTDDCDDVHSALRELLSAREQVEALREYIEFLGKEVVDAWVFLHVHGMKCPQETIDRGVALRARIGRREDGTWEER